MLARVGEQVKLSVPFVLDGERQTKPGTRLVSVRSLPKFNHASADGVRGVEDSKLKPVERRVADLWSVPVRAT